MRAILYIMELLGWWYVGGHRMDTVSIVPRSYHRSGNLIIRCFSLLIFEWTILQHSFHYLELDDIYCSFQSGCLFDDGLVDIGEVVVAFRANRALFF
jgi:hypothetical protein